MGGPRVRRSRSRDLYKKTREQRNAILLYILRCLFNNDMRPVIFFISALSLAAAQYADRYPTTTPVPILKQINRHNEDGSYSYGYENADGSYKIESKYPTGEVYGKYGFVDDSGSVREIEYGAGSGRGFEPAGTGINVPPPSQTANGIARDPNAPEDDGQYREDPSIYYTDPKYTNGERYEPISKRRQQLSYRQPAPQNPSIPRYPEYRREPVAPEPQYRPDYRRPAPLPQPQQYQPADYRPQYRTQLQPEYEQYQSAAPISQTRFQGHPASNIDLSLGSYTVNYKR